MLAEVPKFVFPVEVSGPETFPGRLSQRTAKSMIGSRTARSPVYPGHEAGERWRGVSSRIES
jgi:hypothetical protein